MSRQKRLKLKWRPRLETIYESVEMVPLEDPNEVDYKVTDGGEGDTNDCEIYDSESDDFDDTESVDSSTPLQPKNSSHTAGKQESRRRRVWRVLRGLLCCLCLCYQRRRCRCRPLLFPRRNYRILEEWPENICFDPCCLAYWYRSEEDKRI